MTVEKSVAGSLDGDLEAEIECLRRDLLHTLVPVTVVVAWAWFSCVVIQGWQLRRVTVFLLVLILASYGASSLSRRHYAGSCWVLLLGMIAAQSVLIGIPALSMAMAFGSVVIIVANALLGTRGALLVALLTWVVNMAALRVGTGATGVADGGVHLEALALYLMTLVASWLLTRPLRTAIGWSLASSTRARDALEEARDRRGEVYRALRALEEATYRIERMNNELIIAQHEAEEARAVKARFAATVSHELRGPLNLILGFSKLMALSPETYGAPLPRTYRADVYTIYRNAQHIVGLVDDILDLSRVEAQKLPLVKDRIELEADVVQKVVRTVQPLAERKGLYLRQELAGDLPCIVADPVRLRQALLNLLINAARLTERGGITVRTSRQDEGLHVSVQDTGPGIAAENMPRLFREFHHVQRAETRASRGTGLGLSISKHLIELHGGQVWAESTEGEGATFHITIPFPGAQRIRGDLARTDAGELRANAYESCLIIHDDPDVVRILARYIEDYRVVGMPDGREIVALTEELHPRAIVTTPSLAEQIEERLRETAYDTPIISCVIPRLGKRLYSEGILSYLVKPIMPEALRAVMRKVERDGETTVLLVEDDPDAMRLLERLLMSLPRPYNFLRAYDGLQALDLMKEATPDVVLMDLLMPGLDGWETIARMRADERLREVPVVIISAQDATEDRVMLAPPIHVRYRDPIDIARGADCLRSLITALSPRYPLPSQPAAT